MSTTMLSSLLSLFRRTPAPGSDSDHPLELTATPGLMTLLDLALFRSVEGELTATICAGNALLMAWLDLKHQSQLVLAFDCPHKIDSFARACLEAASDALEKISTDRLASSANLSDAYEPSGSSTTTLSAVSNIADGVADSKLDSGRRRPLVQRSRDCWETARLICPDHVWADDVYHACQRHIRSLSKHPFCGSQLSNSHWEREAHTLIGLVQHDLPVRLFQFRSAIEANGVVSKRIYLVKCEYRAPFRAFLEAHQSVQRAPSLELVDEYLQLQPSSHNLSKKREQAETNLQSLLESPVLQEALTLEQECEAIEVSMSEALFSFTELSRILDHRRARLKAILGVLDKKDVSPLQETVRRLKSLLSRKAGPETSTGIRPLLMDLQGVPRDENPLQNHFASQNETGVMQERLQELVRHLKIIGTLSTTRNAFVLEKKGDVDIPSNVVKDCIEFDDELFSAQCEDWYMMVRRQHEISADLYDLSENIRRAEMEMSIAVSSESSLGAVRQRLELIATDREKRFNVLKEMVEEVCWREMNLHVRLSAPEKDRTLELPTTSARGVFGLPLEMARESLPIG